VSAVPSMDVTKIDGLRAPLVSVIVPTYNYGHFIAEALDSVLAQDYPNTELLVLDDGSTDDTESVVDPYLRHGVRYMRQENRGIGPAKNAGLAATSGPFVGFLDADDAWLPAKLSLQVEHLMRHPEIALVGAAYYDCDEHNRPKRRIDPPAVRSGWFFDELLVRNHVHSPTVPLIRRACLEAVGGFSELPRSQDWDTWLRLAEHYPIGFIAAPVARGRNHPKKSSSGLRRHRIDVNAEVFRRHAHAAHPGWKRRLLRRRSRGASHYYAAASSLSRGDRRNGLRLLLESVALDPFDHTAQKVVIFLRATLPDPVYRSLRALRRRRATDPSRS
jgi:glycosyltransferase involved in cell wall biosynthesis